MPRFIRQLLLVSLIICVVPLQAAKTPEKCLIDGVPYTRQMQDYCGPASLCSLLTYWGMKTDQKTIAKCAFDTRTDSTNGADLLLYCRDSGFSAYSFNGSLTRLKEIISKGFPVLILQEMSRTWHDGHFRIAVGYDDKSRTITLRDGIDSDYITLSYSEFDYLWGRRGRWALVAMPPARDEFADSLGRRNAVVHMDLAQAYLRRENFGAAETECLKALEIEPGNRYAEEFLAQARVHKDPETEKG